MVRRQLLTVMLAAVAAIVIAQPGSSARGQDGGILRVSFSPAVGLDYIDPALSSRRPAGRSSRRPARGSTRTRTRHRRGLSPAAGGGGRLLPSRQDLKTYTFTLRRGFRFSNGEPVRASAFAHAINRVLHPVVQSPGAIFMRDIVGAEDVLAGRTKKARGVVARGQHARRQVQAPGSGLPRPDCAAVLLRGPALAAGRRPRASASSRRPARTTSRSIGRGRAIVIRRNRYYGGERTVHLDGFDVNLRGGNPVELLRSIERGDADWGWMVAGRLT